MLECMGHVDESQVPDAGHTLLPLPYAVVDILNPSEIRTLHDISPWTLNPKTIAISYTLSPIHGRADRSLVQATTDLAVDVKQPLPADDQNWVSKACGETANLHGGYIPFNLCTDEGCYSNLMEIAIQNTAKVELWEICWGFELRVVWDALLCPSLSYSMHREFRKALHQNPV